MMNPIAASKKKRRVGEEMAPICLLIFLIFVILSPKTSHCLDSNTNGLRPPTVVVSKTSNTPKLAPLRSSRNYLIDTNPSYGHLSLPSRLVKEATTTLSNRETIKRNSFHHQQQPQFPLAHQLLPNGPPPFRPSLMMVKLSSMGQLDKLKQTAAFKGMHKSKVYYLFLDALQQLALLVDKLSRKKLRLTDAKLEALRAVVNRLAWKGGHSLKLKWPLVLLNPLFLKEMMSSPTFLVMLFHAVELAYMSSPVSKFWLKPLMKLIQQHSPEKEERQWWRRKRIYDTLYGHKSSELQPNLQAIHFRQPGKAAPFAMPAMVRLVRLLVKLPAYPDPSYYSQPPVEASLLGGSTHLTMPSPALIIPAASFSQPNYSAQWMLPESQQQHQRLPTGGRPNQLEAPQASQQVPLWPNFQQQQEVMMSQQEFDELEPEQRASVLRETRQRLEESRWTDALIERHRNLVDSMLQQQQQTAAGNQGDHLDAAASVGEVTEEPVGADSHQM